MSRPQTASEKSAKEDQRPQFVVILGIDDPVALRLAALEVGPFRTVVQARDYAKASRGKRVMDLLTERTDATAYDMLYEDAVIEERTIAGATVEYYNNNIGTYDTVDVY